MIKGSILREDITIFNVYTSTNTTSNMRQMLIELQGRVDEFTIMVGDFHIPLSEMNNPAG